MGKKGLVGALLAVAAACVGVGVILHKSDTPAPAATPLTAPTTGKRTSRNRCTKR